MRDNRPDIGWRWLYVGIVDHLYLGWLVLRAGAESAYCWVFGHNTEPTVLAGWLSTGENFRCTRCRKTFHRHSELRPRDH